MHSRLVPFRVVFSLLLVPLLLLISCGQTPSSAGPALTPTTAVDTYRTPIAFPTTPPKRIISFAASISEILGALHLEGRVVAVDYDTNYPANLASLPKVSDANLKFNVEQIVSLQPDLILSYGGETQQYDAQLKNLGLHVVDLPASNFTQSLQQILLIGRLTFTQDVAKSLVDRLQKQIDQVKTAVKGLSPPKVMIELDDSSPGKPFVFGGGSFGDELLQDARATNIFHASTSNGGYPQVSDEAVIAANPQFILVTEPPQYGGGVSSVYKRVH